MGESPLAARLERDEASLTVAAFPDGSVDTFYAVSAGERVPTREAFGRAVAAGGTGVVTLHRDATEPGGHAVNVAAQAHRLGDDVTLAGHLDAPAFADLPFETVSMGEPASVAVLEFDDGDLLAVENSAALEAWTLADLEGALGGAGELEAFLAADAVCCVNWTSIAGLPGALASLASVDAEGGWLVVDPGAPVGRSGDDVVELLDALGGWTAGYRVVLAGNPRELEAMAAGIGGPTDDVDAALGALRRRAGVAAVVVHGESRAAAATADGLVTDENFEVEATRHTGGGDRFDAGLAHALARGWGFADALRLGNAAASWYVANGESGTPGELAGLLRDRR